MAPHPRPRAFLAALLTLPWLAACVGGPDGSRAVGRPPLPRAEVASPESVGPPPVTDRIGRGPVKVALVVPLTGQGASLGAALRDAAQLAYDEAQADDVQILVKDDRGTPDGAREATQAALADGAEAILGPLFAANVSAASAVARTGGKPVLAFSTDANVASPGTYLLSFLPQAEVERIVGEAVASGRRSFAALIPETAYGNAVEATFREAVARKGARLAALERYPAGSPEAAVARLSTVILGSAPAADALFIPETADGLPLAAAALTKVGFAPGRVRPLGTATWNDPALFALPALQGGRFAAPDPTGFAAFSGRYQARYGAPPPRVATLAYDAVSLSIALSRQYGSQRFAEATLTKGGGFAGVDGTFRFLPDGTSDRALAVYEIRANAATVVSPAPRGLARTARSGI